MVVLLVAHVALCAAALGIHALSLQIALVVSVHYSMVQMEDQ
jgi:hypothetical protein